MPDHNPWNEKLSFARQWIFRVIHLIKIWDWKGKGKKELGMGSPWVRGMRYRAGMPLVFRNLMPVDASGVWGLDHRDLDCSREHMLPEKNVDCWAFSVWRRLLVLSPAAVTSGTAHLLLPLLSLLDLFITGPGHCLEDDFILSSGFGLRIYSCEDVCLRQLCGNPRWTSR